MFTAGVELRESIVIETVPFKIIKARVMHFSFGENYQIVSSFVVNDGQLTNEDSSTNSFELIAIFPI